MRELPDSKYFLFVTLLRRSAGAILTETVSYKIPDKNTSTAGNPLFQNFAVSVCLALLIILLYRQVAAYDFINLDDTTYVTENRLVIQGLTAEGISEAFLSVYASNWHPLTWISHMLDLEFFGMNPGMHHLVNVLLHMLNSVLLFLILQQMTQATWKSAAVAALFAVHPLHVESVAWIAERKDVLCTFFGMLTILCYIRYARHKSVKAYCLAVVCFILGLASKPMLATLPFVLMLIDFWPLQRWNLPGEETAREKLPNKFSSGGRWKNNITESVADKIPLFVLSVVSCCITLYAQKNAIKSFDLFPAGSRISNAVVAYVIYLGKTIWPFDLSIFYPFHDIPPLKVVLCAVILGLISVFVYLFRKRFPYLVVGWLWYAGTLIPVIGLVQVGGQSMADRYTYIPLIGIFISVVWGTGDLSDRWRVKKTTLLFISVLVLAFFSLRTYQQVGLWKDSETLFRHALEVTSGNYIALYDLGMSLEKKGDISGAITYYEKALEINPRLYGAHNNIGALLIGTGRMNEGMQHFFDALKINPHSADTYYNIGLVYYQNGDFAKASRYFQQAVRENKKYREALDKLDKVPKKTAK